MYMTYVSLLKEIAPSIQAVWLIEEEAKFFVKEFGVNMGERSALLFFNVFP